MMDDRLWAERLVRYQYLEALVAQRRVLELGCGLGRATAFLARVAAQVVGVDVATPELALAWKGYPEANLSFVGGDGAAPGQVDASFDLALVPELQRWIARGSLLSELQRVLRPGGIAVFVVPSADVGTAPGLSYGDLLDYLEQSFEHVRILGEIPFLGRTMADFSPAGEPEAALDCSLIGEDEPPSHYLALCSDRALEALPYTVLQLPLASWEDEPLWLRDQLARAGQERDRAVQRAEAHQRELQQLQLRVAAGARQQADLQRVHEERDDLREQLEALRRLQVLAGPRRERGGALAVGAAPELGTGRSAGEGASAGAAPELDRERRRAEEERARHEALQLRMTELRGQLVQQRQRGDVAERARAGALAELEPLRRRAERAEQRCDALVDHIEQGAAEATRLQQRVAELQALRQNDQWRVDELQGRVAEAELRLVAAPPRAGAEAPGAPAGEAAGVVPPASSVTPPAITDRGQLETLIEGAGLHQREAEAWRSQRAELEATNARLRQERAELALQLERCGAEGKAADARAERYREELSELARRLAQAEGELKRYGRDAEVLRR
ncbi:MAG: methyltransferase domain-containing protein [Proteobacteria bacterium]|nr:methyltransferase domain-containing protein [Pseudomonadota bacterium]